MKAYIFEEYGPPEVLKIKEIEKPIPKSDEVLIKNYATSVCAADWRIRSLTIPKGFTPMFKAQFGYPMPKVQILGTELSGIVEEIGENITRFKVGDRVFASSDMKFGCYAEYKIFNQDDLICMLPENLGFEEGSAMCFGATTALGYLRKAKIKEGQKILINGASGAVGTAAIQLAKYYGADISVICSAKNADLVKSLGAHQVFDYNTQKIEDIPEVFDIIMDNVGNFPFKISQHLLKKNGYFLAVLTNLPQMLYSVFTNLTNSKKTITGPFTPKIEDLKFLADLAKNNHYKPVISKTYNFQEMIDAHHYLDSGHKVGNAVVRVFE